MYYIKKCFLVMLLFALVSLSVNATTDVSDEIKKVTTTMNASELIQATSEQQSFISKYLKNHTKEQNLELFLAWEDNIKNITINNSTFSSNFEKYPNDEYIKDLKFQFSKTGIFLDYNYTDSKYIFSIDYINAYSLFGKYIPDDWALYLKNLSIEQTGNFKDYVKKNETCLIMWEYFILKYPNFEKKWIVFNKIQNYENSYFRKGASIKNNDGTYIYDANVIKAYDKFSQKYSDSNYKNICTRLSNLKKLKHDFISPYNDKFNNIEMLKNEFDINQQLKNTTKNNAKYVFDINNNIWIPYTDEYIRGNYIFLAQGQDKSIYKLYNKNYIELPGKALPNSYNFNDLFIKNGRLFIFSKSELKLKEAKYNFNGLSFEAVEKQGLKELYKGTNIIYLSSLTSDEDGNYKIKIKNKKYPKNYLLYNDKDESPLNYESENNLNIKHLQGNEFEIKNKTILKFTLKTNVADNNVQKNVEGKEYTTEKLNEEHKPIYMFIFE